MSGINPQSIRGTNTGVVVGFSHYPATDGLMEEVQPDSKSHMPIIALSTMTNLKALLPNRISFVFDFKGPSLTTDTACSASGSAFTLAVNEMLLGQLIMKLNLLISNQLNKFYRKVRLCNCGGHTIELGTVYGSDATRIGHLFAQRCVRCVGRERRRIR